MDEKLEYLKEVLNRARGEIGKVMIGQEKVIDHCLTAIFTGQHALVEGVPGTGKTLLVRTLAHVLGSEFSRIQFTPDLMPADITGSEIFNMKTNEFVLHQGPIFTSFLLADEINRAPAKTQSALLQAMQERSVSIERVTYALPENFTVFATQNPVEYEGTYPLPEAQKDRFMMVIRVGYPEEAEEVNLAQRSLGADSPVDIVARGEVEQVISPEDIHALKYALWGVNFKQELVEYLVKLVRATRENPSVLVGAGPRATQALLLASRAGAALNGNDFVSPDDIRTAVKPVLEHRLVLRPEYEIEGLTVSELIDRIIREVPVPR